MICSMAYDNCFSRKLLREENRESRLAEKIRESCGHRQDELKFQQRKKKLAKNLHGELFCHPMQKKTATIRLKTRIAQGFTTPQETQLCCCKSWSENNNDDPLHGLQHLIAINRLFTQIAPKELQCHKKLLAAATPDQKVTAVICWMADNIR